VLGGNQTYTFNTDTGVLDPAIGPSATIPGWLVPEFLLVLPKFTVETGSTLDITGSRAFQVIALDILVEGSIEFNGADGADGADGANPGDHGGNGEDGGDIHFSALGDLTITGHISTNGGDGGAGGSVDIAGDNSGTVIGGNGGNGGNSGKITFNVAGNETVLPENLHQVGGKGGAGGGVTIGGDNEGFASATAGAGGDGGAGEVGGDGGTGGGVTIGGDNEDFAFAIAGDGGYGRPGGSEGGDGGDGGDVTVNNLSQFAAAIAGSGGDGGSPDGVGGYGGIATADSGTGTLIQGVNGSPSPSP